MKISPSLWQQLSLRRLRQRLLPTLLGASLLLIAPLPLRAQSGGAPAELTDVLAQIDAAANRGDLDAVMEFYAPEFRADEAVDRAAIVAGLAKLWERYDSLDYSTQLLDYSQQGDRFIAETETEIRGLRNDGGRDVRLLATLRSRQTIQDGQMIRQDVLAERTQLFVGANPPTIDISLPEQVSVGETFSFDVIVKEPLGNNLLLGGALEEVTEGDRYVEPGDFDLELLQAGGIFKQGRAPEQPEDRWLSAIIIREDGITMVTQRLRVIGAATGASQP
ncbi:MAG: nuclear transport factor 2 family protein [Spirulinaceae cyanobacterium RM2_2_10]|nr:nuclear transport factor 2 family protein [Spirulinaceae cyanobacterium SM2_1_0]NJO19535.1 nuclear transport factor 2 family protein [Spirulinaceae cyanobacterium RM2_2_10]